MANSQDDLEHRQTNYQIVNVNGESSSSAAPEVETVKSTETAPLAQAYTHARLMEALALFPPRHPDAPPSKALIAEIQGPRYQLRRRRAEDNDRLSKIPMWVDDENDSDYEKKKPKKAKK